MSLVSGPGRGGTAGDGLPDELELVVDKHVKYIQSLDTVSPSSPESSRLDSGSCADSAKTNSNTG